MAPSTSRSSRRLESLPASLSPQRRVVASEPAAGTRSTVPLSVAPGAYKVQAEAMTIDGRLYVPTSSRASVPVDSGKTVALEVTYTLNTSASDFHADAVGQTSITLTWASQPRFPMWCGERTRTSRPRHPTPTRPPARPTDYGEAGGERRGRRR